jgi:hypothetical protein
MKEETTNNSLRATDVGALALSELLPAVLGKSRNGNMPIGYSG